MSKYYRYNRGEKKVKWRNSISNTITYNKNNKRGHLI